MDNVDDFSEDLGAKTVRLSLATVGFDAETVHGWSQCQNGCCSSSFTSTPPLGRGCASASWIEVAFCGSECLLVDWSGYRSWLCLLVDRSGFRRIGVVGFSFGMLDFRVALGLFCDGCICIILLQEMYYFIMLKAKIDSLLQHVSR